MIWVSVILNVIAFAMLLDSVRRIKEARKALEEARATIDAVLLAIQSDGNGHP